MTRRLAILLIGMFLLIAHLQAQCTARDEIAPTDAESFNRRLGRGINLGNALEAPKEGGWGLVLAAEHFRLIKRAGFNSVRVPIRWSAHATDVAPYTIHPEFLMRVDWVLEQALQNGFAAVINVHHYDELYDDPKSHRKRFLALWRQIAEHYRNASSLVAFELLNEPRGKLDPPTWNQLLGETIALIRKANPSRILIVGPGQWNNYRHLDSLELPPDDRRIIVTFHYYEPMALTHQGASWVKGSSKWRGTRWTATPAEVEPVKAAMSVVSEWARRQQRPIYLGEFGAYSRADMDSRARWTKFVRSQAEAHGFSWAYWEFASGFGAYDRQSGKWLDPLLAALIPESSR
jgi:endoglucanase